MKKRFVVNENATSLWEELESEKSIKIVGGVSHVSSNVEKQLAAETAIEDEGAVLWSKNL